MDILPIVKGLGTYVPGLYRLFSGSREGSAGSALYCYEVWMKHLTLLGAQGLPGIPRVVAEVGPGGSLGVGLAALLSGADHYCALDVEKHWDRDRNLAVFEELTALFRRRAPRPSRGWPDYDSLLDDRLFPGHILTEEILERALDPARLAAIRRALVEPSSRGGDISIRSCVSWSDMKVIEQGSVDLILSHSVLEHVNDIDRAFAAFRQWLRPGRSMSHQVDLTSHGISEAWNGHWAYPRWVWRIVVGRRPAFINGLACSDYLRAQSDHGFEPLAILENRRGDGIGRSGLAAHRRGMSEGDLSCAGLFLSARLPS